MRGGNKPGAPNPRKGIPNKASLLAREELIRKGINPVDMLVEVYQRAIKAFDSHRGDNEKSDAGASYLSTAGNAAKALMEYYAPKLSAVAVQIQDDRKEASTQPVDARAVILNDPFFQHSLKVAEAASSVGHDPVAPPVLPNGVTLDDK